MQWLTEWHTHSPGRPDSPLSDYIIVSVRSEEGNAPFVQITRVRKPEFPKNTLLQGRRIGKQLTKGEGLLLGGVHDRHLRGVALGMGLRRHEER